MKEYYTKQAYKTEMTLIRWVTDLDFRKTLKMYGSTKLPSMWAHFVRVNLSSIFRKGDIEESFSYTAIQSGILSVFILQILVRMSSSGVCMLKTLHGKKNIKNNLSYSLVTKHGKKLHYILQYVSYLYKSPNNYNNNSTITIFQHQQGIFSSQFHAYLFTTAELHTGLLDQIN